MKEGKKMFRRVKRIGYFFKNLSTYVSMLFKSKQPVYAFTYADIHNSHLMILCFQGLIITSIKT